MLNAVQVRDFEVSICPTLKLKIGGMGTLDSLGNSDMLKRLIPNLDSYDNR